MDNSKRNVHNTGPLGMLVKTGQISKVFDEQEEEKNNTDLSKNTYYETKYGIKFSENELISVDPKECEPWRYANRLQEDMGNIEELAESIRQNKQLQPILIRPHFKPHGHIKYEIIFGRRRHLACLKLGVPILAIKKNLPNNQEAIGVQDAENRSRDDVSPYSNAILYKKLLDDGLFKEKVELAKRLGLTKQSMNDLMAFTKIPSDIINKIPNIHSLSIVMAVKIVSLLNKIPKSHGAILKAAPKIGSIITSPIKLEKMVIEGDKQTSPVTVNAREITNSMGKKLFSLKINSNGNSHIVFEKNFSAKLDYEALCNHLKEFFERECISA